MADKLNIRINGMLGTSHSWAVTLRSLAGEFIKSQNNLYMTSINGYEMFPLAWSKRKRDISDPDLDLTYTLPRNFESRFAKSSRVKMAIYNYETSKLPAVWSDAFKHVDYVLPSSNFSRQVFLDAGWPEDRCVVVPHGINPKHFKDKSKVHVRTNKRFKFLNVSIPHYRKNIDLLLEAYYSEFTDKDDVCLVLKTSLAKPKYKFECSVIKQVFAAQKRSGKIKSLLPQVEIVKKKYDSIVPLYNTCDCLISTSSSEGFGLPLLEGMASGLIVAAPHVTGQADFLNENNSIKIEAKEVDAPERYQYWSPSPNAKTFMPEVDSIRHAMRNAYENQVNLRGSLAPEMAETIGRFTWQSAAKQILSLT